MSVTTQQPKFLPIADAFELVTSYRPSVPTFLRWIVSGKRGVRLKAVQLGNQWRTRIEDVEQFLLATTESEINSRCKPVTAPVKTRSEKARAKAIARAEAELSAS